MYAVGGTCCISLRGADSLLALLTTDSTENQLAQFYLGSVASIGVAFAEIYYGNLLISFVVSFRFQTFDLDFRCWTVDLMNHIDDR